VHAVLEILGAAGLSSTEELAPRHILRRVDSTKIRSYADIYDYCEPGELLGSLKTMRADPRAAAFVRSWELASADHF